MTSKEWKKVKVDTLGMIKTGKTPKTNKKENYGGNIPFLTPTDDMEVKRVAKTIKTLSSIGLEEVKNCLIPKNSICASCIGSDLGKVVITSEPTVTNQQINSIVIDNKMCNVDFIYYSMLQLGKILNYHSKTSTAVPIVNKTQFSNYEILLPPLKTQEKIAGVLSSLDDKIELNNKINQNLEQQAQAIFDKYIKIPCNYLKTGTIGDYCNVKSGFAFKSSWWKDSGVKVIKIKTIDNESINFAECSFVDKEKISIAQDFIVQGGDLLIAMTGATIGKFAIVPKIDEVLLVNQRVGKFFLGAHPIKKLPFLYCTLKQQDIINDIINKGQGSAQPNISNTDILNTSCYILENAELEKFNLTCEPIFEKIITNKYENEKLKQLRDTLLPKLMSGEIDVDKVGV